MSFLTFLALAAALAVVVSLTSGITTMANHGEVAHRSSADWMVLRVVFQAIAVLIIVFSLYVLT